MSRLTSCAPAHFVDQTEASVIEGTRAKVLMHRADPGSYTGRTVEISGERLLNFGGCSYLGLEQRAELRVGAMEAITRYGTQFSFSRAFLESPLYGELEALLEQMTGGCVLVTPSTSLGHIAALPVLVGPRDAVVVDRSAHASVHTAVALLRGIAVHTLPHGHLEMLEELVARLSREHDVVWYLLDGLYSMLGDLAPLASLRDLMARYPALHLYVDDAHATSWLGEYGRGHALDFFEERDRIVVALSLNKAFSAAGGALVFPDTVLRDRVRRCGGPMLFSGPVQPPMLGAAVASARLHLDPTFPALQAALLARIQHVVKVSRELDIPLASDASTPIFFVRCGPVEKTFQLIVALRDRGYYVSPGMFPAVPSDKSGPRFTVSLHTSLADIEGFLQALATESVRRNVPLQRPARTPAMAIEPIA